MFTRQLGDQTRALGLPAIEVDLDISESGLTRSVAASLSLRSR